MKRLLLVAPLVLTISCDKADEKTAVKSEEAASSKATKEAEPPEVKKEAEPPPKPAKPAATEFVAKDHKFSVMSERAPRISNPKTAAGAKTTNYTFNAPGAPGAIMVLVATIPLKKGASKAKRKKALAEAGDSIVKKYSAVFSSDEELMVGEHLGREVAFNANHPRMGKMAGRSKIVIKGSELYQAMWIGDPKAADLIAEGNALLDSFKFTE